MCQRRDSSTRQYAETWTTNPGYLGERGRGEIVLLRSQRHRPAGRQLRNQLSAPAGRAVAAMTSLTTAAPADAECACRAMLPSNRRPAMIVPHFGNALLRLGFWLALASAAASSHCATPMPEDPRAAPERYQSVIANPVRT